MTHFKDDPVNGLGDSGSMILSGLVAGVIIPGALALPSMAFGQIGLSLGLFATTSAACLIAGLVKSPENERAVGGAFNRTTNWTIPTGLSWWIPAPFGQKLQPRRVDQSILVRRKDSPPGSIPQVQTADGGQVDVQVTLTWRIVDVIRAQRIPEAELSKRIEGLLDRQVRYFALGFESDSNDENSRLVNQKLAFSSFITGEANYTSGGQQFIVCDKAGQPMTSDIKARCFEIGVEFERAEVHDVNPPQAVIDARNAEAAEDAQAGQERKDVLSLRARIHEIMWGTSDEKAIEQLIANGKKPLMTVEEATSAARAARGDLTDVRVSGGGSGDFTKAEALRGVGVKKKA